jgi:hypothetical protein
MMCAKYVLIAALDRAVCAVDCGIAINPDTRFGRRSKGASHQPWSYFGRLYWLKRSPDRAIEFH